MMAVAAYIVCGLIIASTITFAIEKRRRQTRPVSGGIDRSITLPHTDTIELYSNSFSHCSRKCRLVLAELGIKARHHSIDLIETGWYQTISPAYLKVNPSGLVPTLVHHGHPVYESDDILRYAAKIADANAPRLTPDDSVLQSRMNQWLQFCTISSDNALSGLKERAGSCVPGLTMPMFAATIQHTPFRSILVGFLFHFDKKRPALFTALKFMGLSGTVKLKAVRDIMHESRDHMRAHLETLNAALANSKGDWILGDQYTLADITLSCLLLRLEETGWLNWFEQTAHIPEVSRYFRRLKARPAWSEAISAHAHPIVTKAKTDLSNATAADPQLAEAIYGAVFLPSKAVKEVASW